VSCAGYRNATITMRMAENLDILSVGRFCLGLGAGWDRPEFEWLDIPFHSAAERSDCLEAVLRACHSAWRGPGTGRRGLAAEAQADAHRRPLLLVGGGGERRTLVAAAAYADAVNWQVGVDEFSRKSRVFADLCDAAGRDPGSVRRTHAPNFQVFDSEREFCRWRQHEDRGMSSEDVYAYIRARGAFYGTASAVEATIEEFIEAGCGGFMIFCNSAPTLRSLQQLSSLAPVRHVFQHGSNPEDGRLPASLASEMSPCERHVAEDR